MDKKVERSYADKVLRRFTNHVKPLGYIRTKPTFWVREREHVVEFIHIHKYTFGPCFRIHTCLRPYNSSLEFVALIGPTDQELCQGVNFEFTDMPDSIDQCATKMASFVMRESENWYRLWHSPQSLLSPKSPLKAQDKKDLQTSIEKGIDSSRAQRTRELLKIA